MLEPRAYRHLHPCPNGRGQHKSTSAQFARALETTLSIKMQSAAIGHKHVLVKSLVTGHKTAHQLCTDWVALD
jgi:hypothetical protein